MKNHIVRNGQLIQVNKKFSSLKQKQKEWITSQLREKYVQSLKADSLKLPQKIRDQILYDVYDMIIEKGISIPFGEIEKHYHSKISSFIRSHQKRQMEKNHE